jgi:hypothetical protein
MTAAEKLNLEEDFFPENVTSIVKILDAYRV